MTNPGFKLVFDEKPSAQYKHGYWYAVTNDSNYDADGATPIDALAALVTVLHEELLKKDAPPKKYDYKTEGLGGT